ncbi:unnamed protein product [Enterobius vermicularis]|uniref:Uncharacterized protein n=1 Tax=Enterobius vermicularis TaxID=51028 RepID=A0A0N4VB10_ENTVE|nr:unnamed protein product [Enterobius vermicularis]
MEMRPNANLNLPQIVLVAQNGNLRPPLPETLIPELKVMLENLFEETSKKRPTLCKKQLVIDSDRIETVDFTAPHSTLQRNPSFRQISGEQWSELRAQWKSFASRNMSKLTMNKAAAVAHFVAAFQICTVSGVDVKVTTSIQSLQCGSFL